MKIVVLGCGASVGVPSVTCKCSVCTSDNPKNKRLRSSIMVTFDECNVLVDSSPDLRYQALRSGITRIDAVIYTHMHFDHCAGINEVVSFQRIHRDSSLPLYADPFTSGYLKTYNPYLFEEVSFDVQKRNYLMLNVKEYYESFSISGTDATFTLTKQKHGEIESSGVVIDNFAYCTDWNDMEERAINCLKEANLELVIVECLRYSKSLAHANLDLCLNFLHKLSPKRAFLTHMSHEIEYETISKELKYYSKELGIAILPAYDGLTIEV